jgi:polyhydroxyalkanoate synthase subunit PhaC
MAQPANDSVRTKKPAETTRKRPRSSPVEPPEDATEAVMGLDMVLVDAARGPLRRLVPPRRDGAALRILAGPATAHRREASG